MKKKQAVLAVIYAAVLVIIDQVIKYLVTSKMKLGEYHKVIGDILGLEYIRNTGSAWGILSDHPILLAIFSIFVLLLIVFAYKNLCCSDRYKPVRIMLITILGGAVGNMIDRFRLKYVVDYIYFKLIDFPVFNFADICVTLTVFLLLFLFIFKYSNNDFDVLIGEKTVNENGDYERRKHSD